MNENALDQDWSVFSLLRFVFPTIIMMIFMGLYTIVDTIFVSRLVNTDALSAINIVCPVVNITVGLGTMIAAGGNAIVSRKLGAGKVREAKEDFTFLLILGGILGLIILVVGLTKIDEILWILGAGSRLFPYCKDYLTVLFWFIPANLMQTLFSNFFVTAGRPGLGFGLTVIAGMANIILDYIFLVPCGMGIRGAALGTGIGYMIPALTGLVFFRKGTNTLSLVRPRLRWNVMKESCLNGSSEMVSQLAAALTTYLFNVTMMDLLGENGVAAITILIYSQFLLNTLFIGFSMGVAPVIGFNYGNKNHVRQKKVLGISLGFISLVSLAVFIFSLVGGPYMVGLFAEPTSEVYEIAADGFAVFSFSFLFCGWNIFVSAMFTALSNGKVSAALSFLRTFGFLAGGIVVLPLFLGVDGVWLAVPAAEGGMVLVSSGVVIFAERNRMIKECLR